MKSLSLPLLAALLIGGCATQGEPSTEGGAGGDARLPENQTAILRVAKATSAPVIDGTVDETWAGAETCEVLVREAFGGGDVFVVKLKAMRHGEALYLLAQWDDSTKSDMRDPYVWNKDKSQYERPTKPDDQFAIQFPLTGDFDISMLTLLKEYSADVWHWKAGRGNPMGYVDDKRHLISKTEIKGSKQYDLGGHGTVFIARPMDEGNAAYKVKETPKEFAGDAIDSFEHREPSGSVADVRGKGVHNGKGWTLEICRKLNTGHADDAVIDPAKDNTCAIAVLNDELYWDHSVSQIIIMRFEK